MHGPLTNSIFFLSLIKMPFESAVQCGSVYKRSKLGARERKTKSKHTLLKVIVSFSISLDKPRLR